MMLLCYGGRRGLLGKFQEMAEVFKTDTAFITRIRAP